MRREEREIKERAEIIQILEKSDILRIAMIDYEYPYIVPMNFAQSINEEGNICLFSHSAPEGRKIELLRVNNRVSFETDIFYAVSEKDPEVPCTWSAVYESVVGIGRMKIVTEDSAKIEGLTAIVKKYGKGRTFQSFSPAAVQKVVVLELNVESISGKKQLMNSIQE